MGYPVDEFGGVQAKRYSMEVHGLKTIQKSAAAGTKKAVAKKILTHQIFMEVLHGQRELFNVTQRTLQSINHQVYLMEHNKIALTAIDDKRYVCSDGIYTRALGHFRNDPLNQLLACFSDDEE